jgi:DNA polymerase III subunit gamma/tau
MLKLLTETEADIRRSTNPRLVVETLLLRWTMLDRLVDLQQVLAGESRPAAAVAPPGSTPSAPARRSPPAVRDSGPAPTPAPGPSPRAVTASPVVVEVGALREAWSDIVAEVREKSRFLGEALGATTPTAVEAPWLTVELSESNPLFAERLQTQAATVEDVLRRVTGETLRLRVTEGGKAGGAGNSAPRRMTEESIKADRLRSFRAKDPALDTAADALDLEIVD